MSDLPECRGLPDDPPFTRVGMDYFGPFQEKRRRGQVKRCSVILMSCYMSCASGSCFFPWYRCMPQHNQKIHFQKRTSQREIRIMEPISGQLTVRWKGQSKNGIPAGSRNTCNRKESSGRHFNPPAGSHRGGSWKWLIRSVRKILNITAKEQVLDEEGLHTLLCEEEGVINSRPIRRHHLTLMI